MRELSAQRKAESEKRKQEEAKEQAEVEATYNNIDKDEDEDEALDEDGETKSVEKKDEFGGYDDDIGGLAATPVVQEGHSNPDQIQKLLTPV